MALVTLKDINQAPYHLHEYLPYALSIGDGIVLCKDGGLMVTYWMNCPDMSLMEEDTRDGFALQLARAFCTLGEGWSAHTDLIRKNADPPEPDTFPDWVSQTIDDQRVAKYSVANTLFESTLTVTLRWAPPRTIEGFLTRLISNPTAKKDTGEAVQARVEVFLEELSMWEDTASTIVQLERMVPYPLDLETGGGLVDMQLSHITQCILDEARLLRVFPDGFYADLHVANEPMWFGSRPFINGQHVGAISVDGLPPHTQPAMMQAISELPIEMRWSSRFIMLTREQSDTEMKKQRRLWEQGSRSFINQYLNKNPMDARQRAGMAMMEEIDAASVEMMQNPDTVRYGRMTTTILLRDADKVKLQENLRLLRSALNEVLVQGRIEDVNATEAVLGSFPGDLKHNIRRPLLHTLHYINMLPLSTMWGGEVVCPSDKIERGNARPLARVSGRGRTSFHLNLHSQDIGHTLIFGSTGSGKSVLLAFLCAQWLRYKNAQVVIFDKGQSLRALTMGVGGYWRELSPDHEGFQPIASLAPADQALSEEDKLWLSDWVASLYQLNENRKPDSTMLKEISAGCNILAEPNNGRTMMDLFTAIQNEDLQNVLNASYVNQGRFARMFDDANDSITSYDHRFMCYEIDNLISMAAEATLPILSFLFHQIKRRATGVPTLVILDEAWALLGHPVFKEQIREWIKTMRKLNVAVVMATQSLSDTSQSGMLDVLAENCKTRIYGSNSEAAKEGVREYYQQLGVSAQDIHIIANLMPKREYYYTSAGQSRVMNLDLSAQELAWVGVSDPSTLRDLLDLHDSDPDQWRERWTEQNAQ